ncbi:hypothetical protein [Pseudoalteromonas lipolytica]|uniref:hypothetical protein n=1 Tax=Pseudoalteromonas lipolytica TaxID=570156 RepID=UPI003095C411
MNGAHGTCVSRARSICNNGFNASNGRRGHGVYFWGYLNQNLESYAKSLAMAWWRYSHKKGDYSKDSDSSCAVILSGINIPEEYLLDLEHQAIREKFIEYSTKAYAKLEGEDDEKLCTMYDMFVQELESQLDIEFKGIHVKVQAPKKFEKTLPQDITGQPSCYIVKDVSTIEVRCLEELGNG